MYPNIMQEQVKTVTVLHIHRRGMERERKKIICPWLNFQPYKVSTVGNQEAKKEMLPV